MKNKNEKLFNSVRQKLFIVLSGIIIIIISILVLTNSLILEAFYKYSKLYNVKKVYKEINKLYNEQTDNIEEEIENLAMRNNIEIVIKENEEIVVYSTNKNFEMEVEKKQQNFPTNPFGMKRQRNILSLYSDENMNISITSNNGFDLIVLSGQLDNGYLVYLSISITVIQESVKISNTLLFIMGIIIIIISAIISFIFSKSFTRPILQLNSIANKMANLDFSEKYRITDSDDEINELGKSINKMSDKLEGTIEQLRSYNNQLEKDIKEKSKIDEMRTQFISDVSHELKTPIALIQGYAEGLIENVNTDEESKKYYAEVILDETNKMDKLVRQLLDLMKLEYGKREFNNDFFDIDVLIKEVIRKCNVMIEEKQVEVEYAGKEKLDVYADSFYIEQAFTNFITNAIKNAKEVNGEKKIVIKTKKEKNRVKVSVFNTGDNIPDDYIEKIWGRFYKIDSSRNRDDGGTGIGLSLVRAIMNNYNSEYGVKNKEDGVEFYFYLDTQKPM